MIDGGTMDLHFATAWEAATDAIPDRDAIVQGERRMSYREYDDQAARFASALEGADIPEGASVALYLYNCPEYLVAQYGAFKHRAVPVNVNYRYLDDELAYLLDNSEAAVIVYHRSLGDRVARVRDQLPGLRLLVEVDDGGAAVEGAVLLESLIASHEPQARKERSAEDLYMLYTGGTTGLPKGVMFRQGYFIERLYGAIAALGLKAAAPTVAEEVAALVREVTQSGPMTTVPCCPLMHGTGMWVSAMRALLIGGTVALLEERTFNAHEVWTLCERERVTDIVIVGDPFARPMLRALEERERVGRPYDTSSVRTIASAGAIWSAEVKDGLRTRMAAELDDLLGSTEGATYGFSSADAGKGAATAHFTLASTARVVTEDRVDVAAGSVEPGLLVSRTAAYGYFKDAEKTARTFLELDGHSYVMTGDWATVEADGTITLLGRGSSCINSGGEKIFAEEVEEAIKRHPGVDDCLVVGLPDERFGQRVVAVAGSSSPVAPDGEALREWLRPNLAHFKIPKVITVLDRVQRAPNGKADYGWARATALANGADR